MKDQLRIGRKFGRIMRNGNKIKCEETQEEYPISFQARDTDDYNGSLVEFSVSNGSAHELDFESKKVLVINFLSGLFYDWGGDTPAEAVWAANDFLKYFQKTEGVVIKNEFDEAEDNNFELIITEIKNL